MLFSALSLASRHASVAASRFVVAAPLAQLATSAHASDAAAAAAAAASLLDQAAAAPPPPFARPASSGVRLVAAIAARAAERVRARRAAESLDKEATLATGQLTPGARDGADAQPADAAKLAGAGAGSGAGAGAAAGAGAGGAAVNVGAEALLRIERAMAGRGVSAGTRAGVRAVLAQKAAEAARAAEAANPVARLAALRRRAEALGARLPLTGRELGALRSLEREQAAARRAAPGRAGRGAPWAAMRIPAPPLDAAASRLRALEPAGKKLRALLLQPDRRADLLARARQALQAQGAAGAQGAASERAERAPRPAQAQRAAPAAELQ